MSDRLIRDEILESERFAALTDNAHRCAFYACLLTADCLGNMEAGAGRLLRLWSLYGIGTAEAIAQTITALNKVDLARPYEHDGKRYLHIPRYRQSLRFAKRLHPLSPWTTDEQKQAIAKNSPGDNTVNTKSAPRAHKVRTPDVSIGDVSIGEVARVRPNPVDNFSAPNGHDSAPPPAGFFEKVKGNGKNPHAVTPLAGLVRGNWRANQGTIAAMAAHLELRPQPGETFAQLADRCTAELAKRKASEPPAARQA